MFVYKIYLPNYSKHTKFVFLFIFGRGTYPENLSRLRYVYEAKVKLRITLMLYIAFMYIFDQKTGPDWSFMC